MINRLGSITNFLVISENNEHIYRSILIFMIFIFCILGFSHNAHALCTPEKNQNWRNYNQDTRGVTKLVFTQGCKSVSICDEDFCQWMSGVGTYFVNLYGKCHPSDCDWGKVEGKLLTSGSSSGWYYFFYNHGFAKRYVYTRTYPQWPGWLRLYVWTDFVDPNRTDYKIDDWFVLNEQ